MSNTKTTEAPVLTREQRFRKIVADHNKKTGFDFTLDELDKREDYKYAHATCLGKTYNITCQMDKNSEFMYALYITFEGAPRAMYLPDGMTKKQLHEVMKSDAFRTRTGALKMLIDLQERLDKEMNTLQQNIFDDSLNEMEKQDTYDTITLTARKLLRDVA